MWQDLRYSVRTLGRHRAFAVAGVIVLALGIGVNTAIFSVINAILFRPLPVHAPEGLRYIDAVSQRVPYVGGVFPYRYFVSLREHTDIFSDLMLMATLRDKVRIGGQIEAAQGESVSSNYFDLLGVKPFIGRAFVWKDDEAANAPRVAIISFDLWQTRFLADPNILGNPLELSRQYGGAPTPRGATTRSSASCLEGSKAFRIPGMPLSTGCRSCAAPPMRLRTIDS